jgi:hypothetical protein
MLKSRLHAAPDGQDPRKLSVACRVPAAAKAYRDDCGMAQAAEAGQIAKHQLSVPMIERHRSSAELYSPQQ